MRTLAEKIRLIAAVVLVLCLSLPLATCTYYENAEGQRVARDSAGNLPADAHEVVEKHYALEDFKADDAESWLLWLAFTAPLVLAIVFAIVRRPAVTLALRFFEPLLMAYCCFGVYASIAMAGDEIAIGGILAYTALGLYVAAMIWLDFLLVRAWWTRRTRV